MAYCPKHDIEFDIFDGCPKCAVDEFKPMEHTAAYLEGVLAAQLGRIGNPYTSFKEAIYWSIGYNFSTKQLLRK